MSAPIAVPQECNGCPHPRVAHGARKPAGACTACTQCDGPHRDHPHPWRRCRCEEFEPRGANP